MKKLSLLVAALLLQGCAAFQADLLAANTVKCESGSLYNCRVKAAVQIDAGMRSNAEAASEAKASCQAGVQRGRVKNPMDCDRLDRLVSVYVPGKAWVEPDAFR